MQSNQKGLFGAKIGGYRLSRLNFGHFLIFESGHSVYRSSRRPNKWSIQSWRRLPNALDSIRESAEALEAALEEEDQTGTWAEAVLEAPVDTMEGVVVGEEEVIVDGRLHFLPVIFYISVTLSVGDCTIYIIIC